MKGIELMLSNMIGISPNQMKAIFEGLVTTADNAAKSIARIEAQNAEIIALLKANENGGSNNDS
jgi:hypothetical protein